MKHINSITKKQNILWELQQHETVDAGSHMSQVLTQLLGGTAGQIPRRQINLQDVLEEGPTPNLQMPEAYRPLVADTQ